MRVWRPKMPIFKVPTNPCWGSKGLPRPGWGLWPNNASGSGAFRAFRKPNFESPHISGQWGRCIGLYIDSCIMHSCGLAIVSLCYAHMISHLQIQTHLSPATRADGVHALASETLPPGLSFRHEARLAQRRLLPLSSPGDVQTWRHLPNVRRLLQQPGPPAMMEEGGSHMPLARLIPPDNADGEFGVRSRPVRTDMSTCGNIR